MSKNNQFDKQMKKDNAMANLNKMEAIYQKGNETLNTLEVAISDLRHMQEDIQNLASYYESEQWRKDFEADEQGLYPEDLRRGVLSEDGIYNLLERNKEILEILKPYLEEDI